MVCNGLAYLGDFDGVLKTFSAHLTSLRPGEPEGFYAYPHTWAEWASRLSGRWDDALTVGDRVAAIVETHERSGTAPVAALTLTLAAYVARARLDRARFERYGAAAAPIVEGMTSDSPTVAVVGLVFRDDVAGALRNLDVERGRAALARVEMLVVLLFDHDVVVDEAGIAGVEARADVHTPFVLARTALVRAVGEGAASLRRSIEELDAAGLRADAARARGLFARITRDAADRAVAEEALRALGDRAYLARLDEPFEPHSG
jgi:hypothetical protein